MRIVFGGQLTEEQFRKAQWLTTPRMWYWLPWIMAASFVMVLVTGDRRHLVTSAVDAVKLLALVAFVIFIYVAPRRAITKTWRMSKLLHERVEGELREDGIQWRTSVETAFFTWDKFLRHKNAGAFTFLYLGPAQALILPRSYFATDEDWTRARQLIAANVAPAKS